MNASPEPPFAEVLRRLRESRSLTQEELAERAGITVKAVGALERGERRRPFPHTVRSLADALVLDEEERAALVAAVPSRERRTTSEAVDDGGGNAAAAEPVDLAPAGSPFIGRGAEVAMIIGMLADGHRLVTLTGPGGVGKTRVALEVFSRERDVAFDSRVVVELSSLRDPSTVLPRIAAALGVVENAGEVTTSWLAPFVAGRRVLVLLDNLEQVIDCAPLLAELVARCPELFLLVTSRAPLRVRSEREVKIAPLDLPEDDSVESVTASPAVAMFLDRADAAGAALTTTPETAATVASICRRLDGLPLAIELAAAQVGLLGPSAILGRLGTGVPDAGPRDLPERQRTMVATLDWSHDLLDAGEQQLFAQLSAFSDGFSLEAVEAVADGNDVLARLGALVDQSLVLRAPSPDGQQARFRLLEPVRQYAVGRLQVSGQATAVADRHADHVRRTGLAARPELRGSDLVSSLDRLEADHANLRSGFLRLVETGRVDEAATLMENLWLYLALRGYAREGLGWLGRLDHENLSDRGRAEALAAAAGLLFVTGDIRRMHEAARPALVRARTVGDPALHAQAAILAGHAAVFTLDRNEAAAMLDEARRVAGSSEDRWATAHSLLGQGQLALLAGDLETADASLTTAESAGREIANAFTLATTLNNRATVTALRADHATTAELLAESIELSVAARIGWTLSYALPAFAGVAVGVHQEESAAFLFGASASLSAAHSADPSFPVSSDLSHQDLVTARDQLDEETFRRSWDAGRAATHADIAELARQLSSRARG